MTLQDKLDKYIQYNIETLEGHDRGDTYFVWREEYPDYVDGYERMASDIIQFMDDNDTMFGRVTREREHGSNKT